MGAGVALAIGIPALLNALGTWWGQRNENMRQDKQTDAARIRECADWDRAEQDRVGRSEAVLSVLERFPEKMAKVPAGIIDWIRRPPRPCPPAGTAGHSPNPLIGGALAGASAGWQGYQGHLDRTKTEPFEDESPGFGAVGQSGFFADAPVTGQTAMQGAMRQAAPVQNDEFSTIPNLTGAQFGAPRPEDVSLMGGASTALSGLPGPGNLNALMGENADWPAIQRALAKWFSQGAGP